MNKKIIKLLLLLMGVGAVCGCSHDKDEIIYVPIFSSDTTKSGTTYDYPNWTAKQSSNFSVTMTAVCELPESLQKDATKDDYMSAHLGGECRAVVKPSDGMFFLNIVGTPDDSGELDIYYWCASTRYLYKVSEKVQFVPNKMYGSVDEPYVFKMERK